MTIDRTHFDACSGGAMLSAIGWGAVAASSLVIGALLGVFLPWPDRLVGAVLAFGAGALISAVSFDLAEEGAQLGGGPATGVGLALGAVTYYTADRLLAKAGRASRHAPSGGSSGSGVALALGAFLDGIPEQAVLGIGLAVGNGISIGLLAAIFISNLPEAVGSATEMRAAGRSSRSIVLLWIGIAVVCALATAGGYGIADAASGGFRAAIDGFAAGALLVMLIDSMIPEAVRKGGKVSGLITVLGFAVAAWLSTIS
jgi:zinc transporter, ZIP family